MTKLGTNATGSAGIRDIAPKSKAALAICLIAWKHADATSQT